MGKTAVVIDANVLLSSAIRPGGPTHRLLLTLLLDPGTELFIPRYLTQEVRPKIMEISERKGIPGDRLEGVLRALISVFRVVEEDRYKKFMKKAVKLVRDARDSPYVALALYLLTMFSDVIILTYNKKDYLTSELESMGITVLSPADLFKRLGI
ncbi:MAG: PIN domain-containing protein [Desulfurococcales archaeon]|nr:PIN domain-containing protein [Desulfurococcales archaeon]